MSKVYCINTCQKGKFNFRWTRRIKSNG